MLMTASTRCSSVFGPAIEPSLVTCPTRMTAMPSPLARSIRRSVASRTWPTLPAAPSSSSIVAVWIESTTTRPGRSERATSMMRPTSCSARTRTPSPDGPSSNPRRAARSRTWPGDSSPVAYSTPAVPPEVRLRPAAAWSRSVDLPMPGSPPSSTSDPGTSPPPRTRSSSAMPRLLRGRSASAMPASPAGSLVPAPATRASDRCVRVGSRTTVSTSVFQPLQARHWPSQRRNASPHDWQTKRLWGRAIARPPVGRRGSPRLDRGTRLREVDVETGFRVAVHDDRGARLVRPEQELLGKDVLDHVLDHPPQRPGAVGHVVAELDDVLLGRVGDLELHLLRSQLVAHAGKHEVDDLGDLLDRQRPEHDSG